MIQKNVLFNIDVQSTCVHGLVYEVYKKKCINLPLTHIQGLWHSFHLSAV